MSVSTLDFGECIVSATSFSGIYETSKKYLGRNISLPKNVSIEIELFFRDDVELKQYFDFRKLSTDNGAKPFYMKLPLFGETKEYLILEDGGVTHSVHPHKVKGKYILYTSRTKDENIPPTYNDDSVSVEMDSTNNYMLFAAEDYDNLEYVVVTNPTHGTLTNNGGGAFLYTPTDGYSGSDSFMIEATDSVGSTSTATMTIDIINWKLNEEFKLVLNANGHLFIDKVWELSVVLNGISIFTLFSVTIGDLMKFGYCL